MYKGHDEENYPDLSDPVENFRYLMDLSNQALFNPYIPPPLPENKLVSKQKLNIGTLHLDAGRREYELDGQAWRRRLLDDSGGREQQHGAGNGNDRRQGETRILPRIFLGGLEHALPNFTRTEV